MQHLLTILAGLVFLWAAIGKFLRWYDFQEYLAQASGTSDLSRNARRVVGAGVILFELALAFGLVAGFGGMAAPLGAATFVTLASGFMAVQILRHRSSRCPCFGSRVTNVSNEGGGGIYLPQAASVTIRQLIGPSVYVSRNTGLCAVGAYGAQDGSFDAVLLFSWTLVPAMLIVAALMGSIVVERRKLRMNQHPRYLELAPQLGPLTILDYYRPADNQRGARRKAV